MSREVFESQIELDEEVCGDEDEEDVIKEEPEDDEETETVEKVTISEAQKALQTLRAFVQVEGGSGENSLHDIETMCLQMRFNTHTRQSNLSDFFSKS